MGISGKVAFKIIRPSPSQHVLVIQLNILVASVSVHSLPSTMSSAGHSVTSVTLPHFLP